MTGKGYTLQGVLKDASGKEIVKLQGEVEEILDLEHKASRMNEWYPQRGPRKTGRLSAIIKSPERWTAETPYLYKLHLTLQNADHDLCLPGAAFIKEGKELARAVVAHRAVGIAHQLQKTGKYYKHICWMAVPPLCMACYLYGLRPLLLCGFALLMGNLCDRLISLLRRRVYRPGDYSNESFALVIALLMPATVDWYVLAAAIVAGVLIGKEVFGGYGSYPFNPAAVGYAVAAVSWPEQVFRYPTPYTSIPLWDASGVATASTISDTLRSGGLINLSGLSLALGEYAAPMGAGSALVLAACGLFLWVQKDIKLSAALSFLVTAGVIVFLFPRQLGLTEDASFAVSAMFRLRCVRDELLTGAMIFSAVFLLNEPYTCAHHRLGRILYGIMVGAFTMGFRYFGVYETGVCFALLAVNSISGWLDRTEVHLYELLHSSWKKQTGKGDAV